MKNIILAIILTLALATTASATTVKLQWDANAASEQVTEYRVYQDGVKVATVISPATTVTLPSVTPSAHSFYVTAANMTGESAPSNTVTMPGMPGAPAGMKITVTVTVDVQ